MRYGVCRNDHPDTSADVHGRDGQFVADCGCHDFANANARLIAAAPDLLDALKRIVAAFEANAFCRDTANDNDPAWAIKFFPHLKALADATVILEKLEQPDEPDPGSSGVGDTADDERPARKLTRHEKHQAMADAGIDTLEDARGER